MKSSSRPHPSFIYSLFILSGLTSLIYEITWTRILSTILGNTSLAVAIIISIFMGGLAIGSFIAARLVRVRPLIVYGALELFIGAYALLTPGIAKTIDQIYAAYYIVVSGSFLTSVLLKSGLTAILLLLPTTAMGATLPILIRWHTPEDRRAGAGLLYGLNTAGAVLGTVLAGYFLLPHLGISRTIHYTATANAFIALIAFLLGKEPSASTPISVRTRFFRPLYLLPLLTGFASISYEVLWTRALSMFFGSSVYAFSAILSAFLMGIAVGSSYYAKRIPEEADPYQFFSLIQFRLALSAVFFIGIFMGVPFLLIKLFQAFYRSFALFQVGQFLLIGCTIFYTTFLSGAAFPAALHFFRKEPESSAAHAGYIYSYNTIGSILGSLCSGFVLIPALGVERSIRVAVLVNLILGILCFRRSDPARQDKKVLAIGGASLILLLILPAWNKSIYNAGFYAFAYRYVPSAEQKSPRKGSGLQSPSNIRFPQSSAPLMAGLFPSPHPGAEYRFLYYGEGLTATIAVLEDERNGIRSLLINGKPDASNVPTGDMRTQLLLGHLPVLLLKNPLRDALVIGLGSGVTAGALSTHHPARIDCVEIEEKVIDTLPYFEAENLGIFRAAHFHLILDDGRNVIQHSPRQYDIITSEPSNLWMSGVANLFTREFFQAARKRLRPGGIMCQWIHLYQISSTDILIFLKTYRSVFPHISIWVDDSDMLVLGSDQPIQADAEQIAERMSEPAVQQSLARSNLTPPNLLKRYVADERIVEILRATLPLNTDDRPILEFSAPRSLFWDYSKEIVRELYQLKAIADKVLPNP